MDPTSFNNILASYAPQQSQPDATDSQQPTAPAQTTQPQSKGNWFTHLLPTAGGILGGLGGEAVDVFGGGVAGAAGGSALGKTLENKLEGQGAGNGVLTNAIEGGAGQGAGGLLGKIGGKVIGAVGGKSAGVADNLVKGQFSKGALSGEDANALRSAGVTDARQIPQVSSLITGPTGALSTGVKTALGQADTGVDITGLDKVAQNAIAEQGLKPSSIVSVGNNLTNAINNMVPGDVTKIITKAGTPVYSYTPKALENALPEKAFAQTQKLEQLASSAYQKGVDKLTGQVTDADQYGQYQVYKQLADELEGRAFGGENQLPLTDEAKSQIISQLDPLKDINPALHTNITNAVSNTQNIQDLRPLQSLWVRANQASNQTARVADKAAGTSAQGVTNNLAIPGAIAGGPHGMMAGLAAQALRSPTADRAAVPLVEKGGSLLSQIGDSSLPSQIGGAGGVLAGTSNNLIQNGSTVGDTMNPIQQPLAGTNSPAPQTGGLSRDDLITLALYSPGSLASLMPNAQQTQNVTSANAATSALTSLGNAPGGGILSSLEGKLGLGATGEYQRKAASAAEQVANAIPGTDKGAIEKQLTDYAAGGGNINDAIKSLLQRLSGVVQSNQNTGLSGILGVGAGAPQTVTSQLPTAVM